MSLSVFDLLKIGIGPSSSHTVGPMRAALSFVEQLKSEQKLSQVNRVKGELFGSLGATGKGHASDIAVILGLLGEAPDTIDPPQVQPMLDEICRNERLPLKREHDIEFIQHRDIILNLEESLPYHPNGMTMSAFDAAGEILLEVSYYSIGGGFVVDEIAAKADELPIDDDQPKVPFPFTTAVELLAHCKAQSLSISQVMMENEKTWRTEDEVRSLSLIHI